MSDDLDAWMDPIDRTTPKQFQVDDHLDYSLLPTGMLPAESIIADVFAVSRIAKLRTIYDVFASMAEEIGEVATECTVAAGYSNKKAGKDGLMGECVDVIVCVLDLIWVAGRHMEDHEIERFIIEAVKKKTQKWKEKQQS